MNTTDTIFAKDQDVGINMAVKYLLSSNPGVESLYFYLKKKKLFPTDEVPCLSRDFLLTVSFLWNKKKEFQLILFFNYRKV